MIGVVGIRRVGWWVLLFVLAAVTAGCGSDGETSAPSSDASASTIVESAIEVDEFGVVDSSVFTDALLPAITEDDIEVIVSEAGTSYRYVFPTGELSDGVSLDLEARWDPVDGGLQPSLTWILTGGESSPPDFVFAANLPKSFAETVDDIVFDPQPDEVFDPDPVVAWEISFPLQPELLSAISTFIVKSGDPTAFLQVVLADLSYIRVSRELTMCSKWDPNLDMMLRCHLNVVAQNPEHFGARSCDGLGRMINLGHDYPAFTHACRTVIDLATTGAADGCDRAPGQVSRNKSEREVCRDLVWELLAGACPLNNALERQICLYEAAAAVGDEGKCDYLDRDGNPEMADDCRAAITKDPSYCVKAEDPDLRASCCENFRGTDTYDTCLSVIETDVTEESTTTTADETTETEPGDGDALLAIPAGIYTGSFDIDRLTSHFFLDSSITPTNTITIAINDSGAISGDFTAYQTGLQFDCPGGERKLVGNIEVGQGIGPALPQTVTVTVTSSGNLTFTSSNETGLECVAEPEVWIEEGSKPLVLESYQDGVITGILDIYLPFELKLVR